MHQGRSLQPLVLSLTNVTLRTTDFVTLKVCNTGLAATSELAISRHVRSVNAEHPGMNRIRVALDDFEIQGPSGTHQCLVFTPLGMMYTQFRNMMPDRVFTELLLQQSLLMILLGLDVLHQLGEWTGTIANPNQTLESRERILEGENKRLFLQLLRKILRWLPEDRPSASDLLDDENLRQGAVAQAGNEAAS